MTETQKTIHWGAPAGETAQGNPDLLSEEVNWDFVDFLSSQEFVPEPSLPSSLPQVENFRQRQKEELEKFIQRQKEAEQAFLLQQQQQEEEVRKKQQQQQQEEVAAKKQEGENQTVTVLLDILAELRSLKQMYQTSLSRPKRIRPSRAKHVNPVTKPTVPPLVISTQSSSSSTLRSPEVGLGRGKGLRQLKLIA